MISSKLNEPSSSETTVSIAFSSEKSVSSALKRPITAPDNFDLSSASTFRPSTRPVLKVLSITFPLLILISEAVVCFFYVE